MSTEKWQLVRCDDGRLMVCTDGDIVCHPDYNHHPYDVWDVRNFTKIAALPQLMAALENLLDLCEQTFVKPNECSEVIDARSALALAQVQS